MDAEAILEIGEQARDCHGIKLGQGAEQEGLVIELGHAVSGQAEHGDKAGPQAIVGGQWKVVPSDLERMGAHRPGAYRFCAAK
jgi:hypothetical protein